MFQLYNLGKDFNQTEDIAAQNPQKVKEMRQKFLAEAKKYQVLPLDASVAARIVAPRPNITSGGRNSSTRGRWLACRRATRPS